MDSHNAQSLIIDTFYNAQGTARQVLSNIHEPDDGSPHFSFQDARLAYEGRHIASQDDYSPSGPGLSFTAGCNYAVPNKPLFNDCTKACQNNTQIFSNPYTMQNLHTNGRPRSHQQ